MGIHILGILLLTAQGGVIIETQWNTRSTPHFEVFHEDRRIPPDFIYKLEAIHAKLKLHLGNFSPWMVKEKIKIYLYKTKQSYLHGEFTPPAWSGGVTDIDKRSVALYEEKMEAMQETLAHEMTHLFFEDYFKKSKARSPPWLTEGLAMLMEEDKNSKSQEQIRRQTMKKFANDTQLLEFFFSAGPSEHASAEKTSVWYLKAYSITRFLYTNYSRLQFKMFCDFLKEGVPVEKALWQTYRMRNLKTFQKEWQSWLKHASKKSNPFSL